jgi:hypothetical protein
MRNTTRRTFLRGGVAAAVFRMGGEVACGSSRKASDIRVDSMTVSFEEVLYRSPLKFAGVAVDRQTMSTATCTVRTAAGKVTTGFGTLPLNFTFTFPSRTLSPPPDWRRCRRCGMSREGS